MLPIDSCLYRISMLMLCLVPLAVRCSKLFVQTPPGKREGPAALPCSSLTAWECLTEGMVPPGLPSTSSGSPQTQEVTFENLSGYFKEGCVFFKKNASGKQMLELFFNLEGNC